MLWMYSSLVIVCALIAPLKASTECVWTTGKLECKRNQSLVLDAVVELYDLDGPRYGKVLYDGIDPDDKMGFTIVDNPQGYFNVEGCANDFDWIPGFKNKPEVVSRFVTNSLTLSNFLVNVKVFKATR